MTDKPEEKEPDTMTLSVELTMPTSDVKLVGVQAVEIMANVAVNAVMERISQMADELREKGE